MAEKTNGFNAGGLFAGDNGKAFFDWMGKNQRAQEIFMGLLEEFGKGMGLQNQVAQVQLGNAAVAAAGFRPGQYVSARQRREAILAATDPDKAAADKLARLQFHGGVANGKWITNYDEWKAAGDKQHTGADGKKIEVKSFGPRRNPLTDEDVIYGTTYDRVIDGPPDENGVYPTIKDVMKGSPAAVVRAMAIKAGGDRRGIGRDTNGNIIYIFGGDGNRADVRREAIRRLSLYDGKTDEAREREWLFDDEGQLKSDHAAVGGGQSGGLSMFGVRAPTNRYDWAVERERAWDRTMDRADRTIAGVIASARRPLVSDYDPVRDFSPRLSDSLMRSSWWDVNRTRQLSNPLYKDVPRAASKGGETMRERGWLDAVFARAERAAMRGGRTRR